jgi:hypothetical protein
VAPPAFGTTCTVSGQVAGVDGPPGTAFSFSYTTSPAKTVISSDISTPTTLDAAGSPYLVDSSKVLYVDNATLTIEPGVEFEGTLKLIGTASVMAIGTADARIRIVKGGFSGTLYAGPPSMGTASSHAFVNVDFVEALNDIITSGAISIEHTTFFCGGVGLVSIGTGHMTDSRMVGCPGIRGQGVVFERNTVLRPTYVLILDPRPDFATFSSFSNNYVEGSGSYSNFTVSGAAELGTCKLNSFINFGPKAFQAGGGGDAVLTGTVDLSENWWGTTDAAVIGTYLWDSTDDSQLPYTFSVEPVLAAPDPATPTPYTSAEQQGWRLLG